MVLYFYLLHELIILLLRQSQPPLRAIMADGVHGPCVLDYEKRDPYPLAYVGHICATEDRRKCIDDKKSNIERLLVTRDRLVVC